MILFYDIFIYPLELFMDLVLRQTLNLTSSPLISLSVLSLIVTIVSLPIYHIAEAWQDREREIQKKLKPKIFEFKSVFKGAALNTYINTLYRQNNYHPIQAVRTSFGLLIQIPFFFAAYHLLSNYGDFEGLKTVIFDDLGKPDGLLSIGNISINVLPFVMTAVNLASSFIYSKKMIGKEKIQLYGIAALFLIVLYNSPAALLYYWTFNNIFSLVKNFIYTKIYKDGVISKFEKETPQASPFISRLNKARPGNWNTVTLLAASATAFFLGFFNAPDESSTEIPGLVISFIPLFILSFFSIISNLKNRSGKKRLTLGVIYALSLLTALTLFFLKITSILEETVYLENAVYFSFAPFAFDLLLIIIRIFEKTLFRFMPDENSQIRSAFNRSALVLLIGIFISAPLTVLSSGSASDFDDSLFYYLSYLIVFSIISFVFLKVIYNVLPSKWKTLFTFVTLSISMLSLVNIFIFPGSYGDMSHFIFKDDIVNSGIYITVNTLTLLLILTVSAFLVIKNKLNFLTPVMTVAIFSLIILSVFDSCGFAGKRDSSEEKTNDSETLFTFSKTGKNVVVLMLDRFIGGYVPQALKFIPELKKDLDGFTWYPNSLSPASYTIGGVPAIMGGWDYYIKNVNSTRTDVPLMDKLDESARIMPYNFDKAGYEVDVYADVKRWFKEKDPKNIGNSRFHDLDLKKIRNEWLAKSKVESMQEDNTLRKQLLVFGLFRAAPVFLRKWIYDEGKWQIETGDENPDYRSDSSRYVSFHQKSQWRRHTCLKYYAVLDFLPEFSKVSDTSKNRFFYLSNNLTHEPHSINANFEYEPTGKVSYPKSIQIKFGKSTNSLKHLYTDTAALRLVNEWIKWMKDNGVYDNTRIILVSDHGRDVYNPFYDRQKISGARKKAHPAYFNNLLMIKDFNEHGEIKISDDFMTSLDVPALAMKDIIAGENPYTGNKVEIPEEKLPFTVYDTQWRNEKQGKYEFKYHEKYEVDKDISKLRNWKLLKEK